MKDTEKDNHFIHSSCIKYLIVVARKIKTGSGVTWHQINQLD